MEHPILDPTIRPQDDLYGHVNNKWLAANPIPESESRWGSFHVLRDEAWKAMHSIYDELQDQSPAAGTVEQQARDFYYTGMHYDELEATHLQEISEQLATVDAATTPAHIAQVLGTLHAQGVGALWSVFVDSDHDDSSRHVIHFHQGGLTLPDRDYYLEDSEKMVAIRSAYQSHVDTLYPFFPALGSSAKTHWTSLIALETELATISRSSADLRDVEKNFNKTTFAELASTYPAIDWEVYAQHLGWRPDDNISVDQPEFFAFINTLLVDDRLSDLKQYLKWKIVNRYSSCISTKFSDINFQFYGKVLSGTTEIMPQWKRVVLRLEASIGDATGKLYAEKHFPESSKQQVLDMVEALRTAYDERIDGLEWLGDEHKTYAKKKLANIKVLIGYPDTWRDFSKLNISRNSYIQNIIAAELFENAYWMRRLHEPTSRDEWFMTPQTVNAYHDPNRLVICFPAAILQAPFFSPDGSLASNMGGIGMVIGHEFTHGFDDQGCQFDAEGNVRTWQSDEERAAFDKKAQIIVDQADNFEVLPGLNMRGKLVLGESIADLGGLEIALHALKNQAESLSRDQIAEFFISYAFTECTAVREEKLREAALTDPHPMSEFRVNAIAQHMDDFYSAFDVTESDKLYRPSDQRARIW